MLDGTRWFKYDRDLCGLFTHKSVPVIFERPCIYSLESFLQLNMCRELQIFAFVYMYLDASLVILDFVIVILELLP